MSFQKLARPMFSHTLQKVPYRPASGLNAAFRVIDYGRISRDEDLELNSMQNQMRIVRNYAQENGHTMT